MREDSQWLRVSIEHADEVAERCNAAGPESEELLECARDHAKLASWLRELETLRAFADQSVAMYPSLVYTDEYKAYAKISGDG